MGAILEGFALGLGASALFGVLEVYFMNHLYVNGKQLKAFEKYGNLSKKVMDLMKRRNEKEDILGFTKDIFGDLIPDDAILLNEKNFKGGLSKFLEDLMNDSSPDFILFSQKLYGEEKRNSISFQYSDYKIIEKNEKFILYEYPQIKEDHYFSILVIGNKEKNIKFINGFLNFLFDIKEEDNIRLKIERKENDNSIEIIFINSNKGNFKFNCVNVETESFNNENIKQLLHLGKTDKMWI